MSRWCRCGGRPLFLFSHVTQSWSSPTPSKGNIIISLFAPAQTGQCQKTTQINADCCFSALPCSCCLFVSDWAQGSQTPPLLQLIHIHPHRLLPRIALRLAPSLYICQWLMLPLSPQTYLLARAYTDSCRHHGHWAVVSQSQCLFSSSYRRGTLGGHTDIIKWWVHTGDCAADKVPASKTIASSVLCIWSWVELVQLLSQHKTYLKMDHTFNPKLYFFFIYSTKGWKQFSLCIRKLKFSGGDLLFICFCISGFFVVVFFFQGNSHCVLILRLFLQRNPVCSIYQTRDCNNVPIDL